MLSAIPLLAFVIAAYFGIAVFSPELFEGSFVSITLPSEAVWGVSVGQVLVAIGLIVLYVEILKSTKTNASSIFDHALSLVVFVACLVAFLILPMAGTSTFFLLMLMQLLDVVAGFTVTISTARRDIDIEKSHVHL